MSFFFKSSNSISSRSSSSSSSSSSEPVSDPNLRQIISARSKQRSQSQPARTRQSSFSSSSKESFVPPVEQLEQRSHLTAFTNTHETIETAPFVMHSPLPPIQSPLRLDQLDTDRTKEKPKKRSASLNRIRHDSPVKSARRVSSDLDAEDKAIANE